jgi:hypothetical protein
MMARPRNPKPKKSNNDYRGGAALLKKQQEANTKKYKAMTPAQKKAYNIKQAKAIGKTAAQVASMVGGAGLARKAGAKVAGKVVASGVTRKTAAAARARGKEYMKDKYFTRGTVRPGRKEDWTTIASPKVPKRNEFAKVSGDARSGRTARLNPVGRTARALNKVDKKRKGQLNKDTAKMVGIKDMRTARGVAKDVLKRGSYRSR